MIGIVFIDVLNSVLGDPTLAEYENARIAVAQAGRVQDAVEATDILDQLDNPAEVAEARAVLGAIPPAVDQAILGALGNAFERQVPVSVAWLEGERIEVQVSEQVIGTGTRVRIAFMSPPGQTLVPGRTSL